LVWQLGHGEVVVVCFFGYVVFDAFVEGVGDYVDGCVDSDQKIRWGWDRVGLDWTGLVD
jgi:hypothetical protein